MTDEQRNFGEELADALDKIAELFAAEYARGHQDAVSKILQAANTPVKYNGHDETRNTSGSRAPRGAADALIKRVLAESGSNGSSAAEIFGSALNQEKVSQSGVQFALNRGRDRGLYRDENGRWSLVHYGPPDFSEVGDAEATGLPEAS